MASAFAHVVVPMVIYVSARSEKLNPRVLVLAMLISVLPDLDVVAFYFGIPYESPWGHRGFTHSILFAVLLAFLCSLFTRMLNSERWLVFIICFVSCMSHALLDALTNGGLGVALYWPISDERFFFETRPIQVSPIGVASFFTERGLRVISSELVWVFLPGLIVTCIALGLRRKNRKSK